MHVELDETHRQAMGVGILLAVLFVPIGFELGCPRLKGQVACEVREDVPERRRGGSPGGETGSGCTRPSTNQAFCQTPVKSGLPSAVLGVGACRFTRPSGVRGTFRSGCAGHCA
jgi:hypothetical protein